MSRATWSGSISFGLVEIPVTLHLAEAPENEISFHMLDKRSMQPVGNKRYNKETGEEVEWGDIVKGYETDDGDWVILTPEEIQSANLEKSETIDILGFVEAEEIEPIYFDKPYYLKPQKKGSKGYKLLHDALVKTKRAGVAQVVLRNRQHLCALVPREHALALILLRYGDEVRAPEDEVTDTDAKGAKASAKELELATKLIEGMSMSFDPSKYHDSYRDEIMGLIERKIESGKTKEVMIDKKKRKRASASVVDLMPLLKQSIEGGGKKAEDSDEEEAPRKKRQARPATAQRTRTKRAATKTRASRSKTTRKRAKRSA